METLNHAAMELLLLELRRLPHGPLVVLGDLDADDAAALSYEWPDGAVRFVVRFHGDLEAYKERELAVDAAWWPEPDPNVRAVVVFHSKEKEATDMRVASALASFPGATELFIVGHNKLGTGSLHKRYAKNFVESDKVAVGRHSAIVRLSKPIDGQNPADPAAWWKSWAWSFDGETRTVYDLPGVFSRGELDRGSEMLMRVAPDLRGDDVLDLGCGIGLLGLARALRSPTARVTLVDHDIHAVASAQRNIEALGLSDRVRVLFGDMNAVAGQRFDTVITNPPFHAGSAMTTETSLRWIEDMNKVLRPGGDLSLVANRFLAYVDALEKTFKQVRVLEEDSKFRVWYARQIR